MLSPVRRLTLYWSSCFDQRAATSGDELPALCPQDASILITSCVNVFD